MDTDAEIAVQNEDNLQSKKKGWRRFLSFFTSGKSKSKKVGTKIDQKSKKAELVISSNETSKDDKVKSEEEVSLNSEAAHIVENVPVITEKRKRLSLNWMFKKKDAKKSKDKLLSSQTNVEVFDKQKKFVEDVKEVDESINEAGDGTRPEGKVQGDSQLDVEQIKQVKSTCDVDSEVSKIHISQNLIVALSACPSIGEIVVNNLQLRHEPSCINETKNRESLRRFIKNPFGRRNPSKTNLSSMGIVKSLVEDEINQISIEEKVNKDRDGEIDDKSVAVDITTIEAHNAIRCQVDKLIETACEADKEELNSESWEAGVADKLVDSQGTEGKYLETSSQTAKKYESKMVSTGAELTIDVVPVESPVKSLKILKIDTDSKTSKVFKTQRKLTHPYRQRTKNSKCNLPSKNMAAIYYHYPKAIHELPENNEDTDEVHQLIDANENESDLENTQDSKSSCDQIIQTKNKSIQEEEAGDEISKDDRDTIDCEIDQGLESEGVEGGINIKELKSDSSKLEEVQSHKIDVSTECDCGMDVLTPKDNETNEVALNMDDAENKSKLSLDDLQKGESSYEIAIQKADKSGANEETANDISKEGPDFQANEDNKSDPIEDASSLKENMKSDAQKFTEEIIKQANDQELQSYDPKITGKNSICIESIEVVPISSSGKILVDKTANISEKSGIPYRNINFDMPTIHEDPENDEANEVIERPKTAINRPKTAFSRPKTAISSIQKTHDLLACKVNHAKLESNDKIMTAQPDKDDKNPNELPLIGDNPIVGQDSEISN